jgi:SH3-like domain-containing protein
MKGRKFGKLACLLTGIALAVLPAAAMAQSKGTSTNLPVPRFVSLKADKVNLRTGPTRDNAVNWVFTRAGLPVEITA